MKLFCAILPNIMANPRQKDRTQKITQQKLPFESSALFNGEIVIWRTFRYSAKSEYEALNAQDVLKNCPSYRRSF